MLLNYKFHTIHFRGFVLTANNLLMTPFSHGEAGKTAQPLKMDTFIFGRYPFSPIARHGCDILPPVHNGHENKLEEILRSRFARKYDSVLNADMDAHAGC